MGKERKMNFFKESDLEAKQVLEGITVKSAFAEKTMMTFFEFQENTAIPAHKHPHEQITYIVEGMMEFTLDGETKILQAGDGVVILSNQEHSARTLDKPVKAIDAWHPVREDYS